MFKILQSNDAKIYRNVCVIKFFLLRIVNFFEIVIHVSNTIETIEKQILKTTKKTHSTGLGVWATTKTIFVNTFNTTSPFSHVLQCVSSYR